ncbi:glycine cleavage system aminomethyltransferase GcvT [Halobellus marinus]|uniref:glycine cleavage system aminomethyltransferase GcvT n=1 Tax=Halobellus TaxID=1073986 RepID=UPI0028ACFF94|nr:glycine cleavage system aminomethyltransferase GcvT [Halobellus sp. DFY28]
MSYEELPLSQVHEDEGANVTNVTGWQVPIEFNSIRLEHNEVRNNAGRFDVSHLCKIRVSGPDATRLVGRVTTNRATDIAPGEVQASCILAADGTMLEYVTVYRVPDSSEQEFLVVGGPGNDGLVHDWIRARRDELGLQASVENSTRELAMLAVQGPDAERHISQITGPSVGNLDRFEATYTGVDGTSVLVSRTGYTGEDGFELFLPWTDAPDIWNELDCQPCGIGARDTLRLEAGLIQAGNEFHHENNERTPLEAGLENIVDFQTPFVGKDALETESDGDTLIGLKLRGRGVPKQGCAIQYDGTRVGRVTSGVLSPTLNEAIGLGYVSTETGTEAAVVEVEIRNRCVDARVVDTQFYTGTMTNI